ncbi:hypothetical protein AB0D14_20650 [Streptomyces sp. NPDC048484]|uniref:hypothetical protein n=1 Tax=Streptomyces sp. NPDC048484 TaxID=3155146 RepID=UPI00343BB21F
MSTATFTQAPVRPRPPSGAAALQGSRNQSRNQSRSQSHNHSHRFGDTLRAVKVFAGAALGVVLLGEYGEEAGVRRR